MNHHVERVSKHDQKAPNLKEILAVSFSCSYEIQWLMKAASRGRNVTQSHVTVLSGLTGEFKVDQEIQSTRLKT